MTFIQININHQFPADVDQKIRENQENGLKVLNNDNDAFAEEPACRQPVLTPSQLKKYCEAV